MSSIENINFNFEQDLDKMTNDYPATDVQWIYINDLNTGNYQGNYINFSNMTVVGNSAEKYFDWSQAYVAIPYTVTLTATGCRFGSGTAHATAPVMTPIAENAYAVGCKGFHHFIDTTYIKYNGQNVNRNSSYVNFMMNENLKKMGDEEYRLIGDILCHSYDSSDSLLINPVNAKSGLVADQYNTTKSQGLEVNNAIANGYAGAAGFSANYGVNKGHLSRMEKINQDLVSDNTILKNLLSANTIGDCFQNCYLGPNGTNDVLQWTGVATIPLSKICDFFDKVPTVASAQGFEFKIQTNIGGSNSYNYNFTASANGQALAGAKPNSDFTLQSVSATQSIGHTCPFIVSPVGHKSNTGLSVYPLSTTAAGLVTLTSQIGYNGNGNSVPCRIYVPTINYTPKFADIILKQPPVRLLYEDFYVHEIKGFAGGSSPTLLYPAQLSRPRTMYIIPFFNNNPNSMNCGLSPYQQCLSSAPNTCSPCRITNLQVSIGGNNIFVEPQAYNFHYYNNQILSLLGDKYNGNSLKSRYFGGQITKTMWEKAYGVLAFNMQKVSGEVEDNLQKSFQIGFKIDTPNTLVYDFLIIMTYQTELYMDRSTGTITLPTAGA
jgi:hypothetical protein